MENLYIMDKLFFTSIAKGINLEAAGINATSTSSVKINYLPVSSSIFKGASKIAHSDSDDIEKGGFAETFEYMDTYKLPIRKKGKDIKQSLTKIVKYMESEKAKCYKSMVKLKSKCGKEPESNVSKYMLRGLDSKLGEIPKLYSYMHETMSSEKETSEKVSSNKMTCMHRYNDEARNYISICIDKIYAETILNGLDDDREYVFNVKQATKL